MLALLLVGIVFGTASGFEDAHLSSVAVEEALGVSDECAWEDRRGCAGVGARGCATELLQRGTRRWTSQADTVSIPAASQTSARKSEDKDTRTSTGDRQKRVASVNKKSAEAAARSTARAEERHKAGVQLLLRDHNATCKTVILSDFITGRKDWQRNRHIKPSLEYFEKFYESVLSVPGNGVKAVVLHDGLPKNITDKYTTDDRAFSFVRVNLTNFQGSLGVNDLRFVLFHDMIEQHPEWDTVFMTDLSDVAVRHNPCHLVALGPSKLYLGREGGPLALNPWMGLRFKDMGGKYLKWYRRQRLGSGRIQNAGIIGGRRELLLGFLTKMVAVMSDPELAVRRRGREVNVNMAALNWVVHNLYRGHEIFSGIPLHSRYKGGEDNRSDVYFIHK
mmetsp:Transcript_174702/g.560295  ORF Transcript_174702/g.560295 Transcript_174702/m.560295 type:complete len:391 (-) Transcript_174702:49-1221(-)